MMGQWLTWRTHAHPHPHTYFMRILRAMARSSPSRSCKISTVLRENRALEVTFLSGQNIGGGTHTHTTITPVVCVPVVGSLPGLPFYPPCLQNKGIFRDPYSAEAKRRFHYNSHCLLSAFCIRNLRRSCGVILDCRRHI